MKNDPQITNTHRRIAAEKIAKLLGTFAISMGELAQKTGTKYGYLCSMRKGYKKQNGDWHCPAYAVRALLDWGDSVN